MAYTISKKNDHYFVQNGAGRVLGHHKTKKEAQAQVSAVSTSEAGTMKDMNKAVKIHMSGGTYKMPEKSETE